VLPPGKTCATDRSDLHMCSPPAAEDGLAPDEPEESPPAIEEPDDPDAHGPLIQA